MTRISTPCVGLCWIDPAYELCAGCGRTRDELAQWCLYSEAERLARMGELAERLARAAAEPASPARVPEGSL